jgi:glycerol-3-phosphate O-acyltransferase
MAREDSTKITPSKPYEPNRILRWIYESFFRHIDVDDRWAEVLTSARKRGVVVYVMRSVSFLDFFCLDYLTKRFGMPLIRFVNDLGLWILEPFGKGRRRLRLRRQIPEDRALHETVRERFSALLFLRRPPRFGDARRASQKLEVDLLKTLVETQRQLDDPILLVPQTFVWSKLPPTKRRSILDLFFGPVEWPGRIRVFFQFLLNSQNALLRTGDPFDLKAFVETHQDHTDAEIADRVRYALLRIMERERTILLGPSKKTPGRIRDELLRSPRVLKHVEAHARATSRPLPRVLREARRELRRLTAAPDPYVLSVMQLLLEIVWNRIYDGLEVDKAGMARARDAVREGSLVLLPSHKSHIDYLVLSDVLARNGLSPPLIAAGDNLNFFPIGPILRRAGAFFIRRSFSGRRLYSALVDAYIRKLIVEGFTIEFFIEGGRSRTGKLLEPKLGLLSMVIDAALLLPNKKVLFAPVSVSYERIVEERSYVHEAEGGEKKGEGVGRLLRSSRILRSRFGRLYVEIGEILSFDDLLRDAFGGEGEERRELSAGERRTLVQKIAYRVIDQINRVAVVTPSALVASVLLAHRRRGIAHEELVRWCLRLIGPLEQVNARFARSLFDSEKRLREETIIEILELFMDGKLVVKHGEGPDAVYTVADERRIAVEYYKNNILHFFVGRALIAAALTAQSDSTLRKTDLHDRVQELSRLFKYEFTYRADASFGEIFEETLGQMVSAGEVEIDGHHVRPRAEATDVVMLYANMIYTYFESYRLAFRATSLLEPTPLARKDWIKKTLALGQRMYLAGEIELRESLSKHRIENAMRALRESELLKYASADLLERGRPSQGDVGVFAHVEPAL